MTGGVTYLADLVYIFPALKDIRYIQLHAGSDHTAIQAVFNVSRQVYTNKPYCKTPQQKFDTTLAAAGLEELNDKIDGCLIPPNETEKSINLVLTKAVKNMKHRKRRNYKDWFAEHLVDLKNKCDAWQTNIRARMVYGNEELLRGLPSGGRVVVIMIIQSLKNKSYIYIWVYNGDEAAARWHKLFYKAPA